MIPKRLKSRATNEQAMFIGRKTYSLILLLMLAFSGVLAFVPAPTVTAATTTAGSPSSCPANQILRITWYGGVPTNFNSLLAYNSGYPVAYLMYKFIAPVIVPSGQEAPGSSITDVITHNANNTVWTFHVAPNQYWANGVPVTAQNSIMATMNSSFALNPQYDPVPLGPEIANIKLINASTVEFDLNVSDASFPQEIDPPSDTAMYSSFFTSQGPSFNGFGTDYGDGPFYLYNYTAGSSQLIMLRNPYYNPVPKVCELIWNYVETQSADATYLVGNQVDLTPILPQDVQSLSSNPNLHVYDQKGFGYQGIQYNVTVYPYNMTQFRQALAYGINQNQLVSSAYLGYAVPAYDSEGSLVSNQSFLWNPNQVRYNYNISEALDLFHQIGFTGGSSGSPLKFPNGTNVALTMWVDSRFSGNQIVAGLLQQQLSQIGITLTIQSASFPTLVRYFLSNTNDIQHELVLHSTTSLFTSPIIAGYPAQTVSDLPGFPFGSGANAIPPNWEPNPTAQAQYNSNFTALKSTANVTLQEKYLYNIEAIDAINLPVLPIVYFDALFGYSTARFTNWPSNPYLLETSFWNYTGMALISPVGATTSQSVVSSSSTSVSTVASSNGVTTGSTTTSGSSSTLLYVGIAVVVIIVIGALAAVLFMRRGKAG
jgi:ABC-type transport system substrate-binding protein